MKKQKPISEDRHRLVSLAISKDEADNSIKNRIIKGNEIKQLNVSTEELLKIAENEYNKWDKYNAELLKRYFDSPEISEEYSVIYGGFFSLDPSFDELVRIFQKDLQEKIERLESIKERLSLFSITGNNMHYKSNQTIDNTNKNIFIVHGHDAALKESVARFITKLNLNPIILSEQANKGSTLFEKFIKNSDVSYAIVLLTPDDKGAKKDAIEFKFRARQNVIFELGYFIGKLGKERVCALYNENVECPSDFHAVVYIPIDQNNGWQLAVARELKSVGLEIDFNLI